MWYIKACPWLEQLTTEQCARLERVGRSRTFAKGSTIYLPADLAQGVLLVAKGRVRISSITPQGKQAILTYIEAGELFGEQALLEESPREEHAETVVASQIVWLPAEPLRQMMEESPGITLGITHLMGLRRKRIERRLKSLLYRSNRDRLVQLLLDLAEQYGRTTRMGRELGIKLSHQELAGLIGSTRESVTVLLSELRAAGQIQVVRRMIVLRDPARLARSLHDAERPREVPSESLDRRAGSAAASGRHQARQVPRA